MKTRPFTYNTGSYINGTKQVGRIAISDGSTLNHSPNPWYNGPNEDLGYIICGKYPDIIHKGLVLNLDASNPNSFKGEPTTNLSYQSDTFVSGSNMNIDGTWAYSSASISSTNNIAPTNSLNNAYLINLTSAGGGNWDLYRTYSVTSGLVYTFSIYVKLGTATNFCIVVNNTQYWNTVTGSYCFTASNLLNTNSYTKVSITFIAPSTNLVNIHLGGHFESYITTQSAGSVYLSSHQLEQKSHATAYISTTNNTVTRGTTYATGGGWCDLSGYDNHGELINNPTYDSSNLGSIVFDGVDDYISNILLIPSSFTLSCWFKHSGFTFEYENHLICSNDTWTQGRYRLYYTNTEICFYVYDQGISFPTSNHLIGWHNIVVTYNGTTLVLLFDGIIVSSSNKSILIQTSALSIGKLYITESNSRYYYGNISNILIYNRTLTLAEIIKNFNVIKSNFFSVVTDNLILHLDASDSRSYPGTGTIWYDISGYNRNHTLYGNPQYILSSNFYLDGESGFVYNGALPNSTNCTVVIFYSTTDTIELWVRGNQNGMYYVAAAYPNSGYYQENAGTPTYYVDLNQISDPIISGYRNGDFHMWEAKNVNFSLWNYYEWFLYGGEWTLIGNVAKIMIYDRILTAEESLQNYNYMKYLYMGLSSNYAANSALDIKLARPTAPDGVYWINLPIVGATQVYCLMDDKYDGGGWMLMMKATIGTTFNYDSTYWTTNNTLNPNDLTRNDADAKYNTMNYFQAKDMMAIFPDITTNGVNSGSISNLSNWSWLENDFNSGIRTIPINFFANSSSMSRYHTVSYGGSGNFIKDAKTFSGWASGVFSSQVDIRFYGFNYVGYNGYNKVRWGFGWNENGDGLFPSILTIAPGSNDVSGGIGMDSANRNGYSAGDHIGCCQDTTGINRSARVEVYVR